MDFDLSKPQQLLRESARDFFARACPTKRVRELMAGETAFDANLWREIADQGWIGLHLPESDEGLGLSAIELAVVAEEMGRACLPGPFLATMWAATLLAKAGNAALRTRYLTPMINGSLRGTVALLEPEGSWDPDGVQLRVEASGGGYRLSGRKMWVLDAADADVILCAGKEGNRPLILAVPRDARGVTLKANPAFDATRKLYEIDFKDVAVAAADVVAAGDAARKALESSIQIATVAVCAEMMGVMQWELEHAVEYAKTRQQFDKTIGTFQAVQHMCADMLLLAESSRSAAYYAAWAVSANIPEASMAVSTAKAYASDAVREVGNRGVQVHGGIGFTWEHDLHLYYKRGKANEVLFGDATFHRERLARLFLDAQPA